MVLQGCHTHSDEERVSLKLAAMVVNVAELVCTHRLMETLESRLVKN